MTRSSIGWLNLRAGGWCLLAVGLAAGRGRAEPQTGGVFAWGNEILGAPAVPEAARRGIIGIAAGTAHLVALRQDGTVLQWRIHDTEATPVPDVSGVVTVAAGRAHTVALRGDGTVAVWGQNHAGQLEVPPGLNSVTAVSASADHTFVLRSDGTVVGWGAFFASLPVPPSATNLIAIATGEVSTLAVRADGTVLAWSLGGEEQWVPESVKAPTIIASSSFFTGSSHAALSSDGSWVLWGSLHLYIGRPDPLEGVRALAARGDRFLALTWAGEVLSWKTLQRTDTLVELLPVPHGLRRVLAVASGETYSMALVTPAKPEIRSHPVSRTAREFSSVRLEVSVDDPVLRFQWRHNGRPIPGATQSVLEIPVAWMGRHEGVYDVTVNDGTYEVVSDPATLTVTPSAPGALVAWDLAPQNPNLLPEAAQSNVRAVSLGGFGGVVLYHDGRVSSWPESAPEDLRNVVAVAAGSLHRLALHSDGHVSAWGDSRHHQATVPPGLSGVVAISAGSFHSLALRQDGTVVAWGDDAFGQCSVPVELSNVTAVAAGYWYSVALRGDGTVVLWGGNGFPGTQMPSGLRGIRAVAAGGFHTLALLDNGTVTAWGANGESQTRVPAGLSGVVQIAAGFDTSMALTAEGRLICWGSAWIRSLPAGLDGVEAIAAGADMAVALIGTPRLEIRGADGRWFLEWSDDRGRSALQTREQWEGGDWQTLAIPPADAGGVVRLPIHLDDLQRAFRLARPFPSQLKLISQP